MLRVSEDGNRKREGFIASYRQLSKSLLDLQHASDRVFDTISESIAKEQDSLTEISQRIQIAKARIAALSRSKQALIIRSPSQYPSRCIDVDDFHPLYEYKDGPSVDFPITKLLVNGGLNREFGIDGTLELFQFFSEANSGSPSKVVHSKVGAKLTHSDANTFLENLLEPESFTDNSFWAVDSNTSDCTLNPKNQGLPPPPPSLLLNNFPPLRKSEGFSFRPAVKPVQTSKLPDTFSDLTYRKKDGLTDLPVVSDLPMSGGRQEEEAETSNRSSQTSSDMVSVPTQPPLSPLLSTTSAMQTCLSGGGIATATQNDESKF